MRLREDVPGPKMRTLNGRKPKKLRAYIYSIFGRLKVDERKKIK